MTQQQTSRAPALRDAAIALVLATQHWIRGLVQRLQELGWTNGRNIQVEIRFGDARILRGAKVAELPVQHPTKIRANDQRQNRQGTGPEHSAHAARPR